MGILDYGILLVLGLWLIFALRPRGRGCGGSCERCSRHCGRKPRAE